VLSPGENGECDAIVIEIEPTIKAISCPITNYAFYTAQLSGLV